MPDDDDHQDAVPDNRSASEAARGERDQTHLHPQRVDAEPEIIARLEMLDDVIFAAIEGDAAAMEKAADAWHATLADLGPAVVDESRREYLRHARFVWETLRHQPNHPPHKLFAAIEIISLLAGQQGFQR